MAQRGRKVSEEDAKKTDSLVNKSKEFFKNEDIGIVKRALRVLGDFYLEVSKKDKPIKEPKPVKEPKPTKEVVQE